MITTHGIVRLGIVSIVGACLAALTAAPAEVRAQSDDAERTEQSGESDSSSDELTEAEQEKFDRLVKQGRAAFKKENWSQALKAFEQAYEIKESTNLLFNMGLISEKAGNLGQAVEYYERFVSAPGISLDMRQKVQKRLEVLRPIVENEERKKRAEGEKMPEDQGLKQSDKEGSDSGAKDDSGGSGVSGPSGGNGGAGKSTGGGRALPKVLVASGAASLLASGGLLLAAQSNIQNFETGTTPADRRQARRWHRTNTYLADGLLVAGTGLAATGIVMWLTGPSTSGSADAGSPTVTPAVGAERVGISISGSF